MPLKLTVLAVVCVALMVNVFVTDTPAISVNDALVKLVNPGEAPVPDIEMNLLKAGLPHSN